jgi:hypothetical protein
MSEDENMSDVLLQQNETASKVSGPELAERIIRRQRLWVRVWAIASAGFWVVTALYLLVLVGAYLVFVHPAVQEVFTVAEEMPASHRERAAEMILLALKALFIWPILLIVAAACTTGLTLVSRRATLRQIQVSLADISEQLRRLV